MDFKTALRKVYIQNPCQVLPNAIWKTLASLESYQSHFEQDSDGIRQLAAWQDQTLFLYWDRERAPAFFPKALLKPYDFALLHADYMSLFRDVPFQNRKAFFRMARWDNPAPGLHPLRPGFSFQPVCMPDEAEEVNRLIHRCYPGINLSTGSVLAWTSQAVYDPGLWVWVVDETAGRPVGLGIAELDTEHLEGSLEWIQVLPDYRRQGLGSAIVSHLSSKLATRATFITVSGESEHPDRPQQLYRRCGFAGEDIWWVLGQPPAAGS